MGNRWYVQGVTVLATHQRVYSTPRARTDVVPERDTVRTLVPSSVVMIYGILRTKTNKQTDVHCALRVLAVRLVVSASDSEPDRNKCILHPPRSPA